MRCQSPVPLIFVGALRVLWVPVIRGGRLPHTSRFGFLRGEAEMAWHAEGRLDPKPSGCSGMPSLTPMRLFLQGQVQAKDDIIMLDWRRPSLPPLAPEPTQLHRALGDRQAKFVY